MNRRVFLKVTGLAAVAGVGYLPFAARGRSERAQTMRTRDYNVTTVPSGARLTMREPGTYRISGQIRLDDPLVEITGIQHSQQITWSGNGGSARQFASFTAFEDFGGASMTRTIHIRGGHLESVTAVPVHFT